MHTENQYQQAEFAHNSWAEHYDYVYHQTYGDALESLTKETVSEVTRLVKEGSSIIDYGCGTGRLTIPLALAGKGYKIHAVDSCQQLLNELTLKCEKQGIQDVNTYPAKISEYDGPSADMALATLLVLNYISTKDEMQRSLENIAKHLNPGGHLMFDLPLDLVFHIPTVTVKNPLEGFYRQVELTPCSEENADPCYSYHDTCKGIDEHGIFGYENRFIIRRWTSDEIEKMLLNLNFERVQDNVGRLNKFGVNYFLFKRI